MAGVCRSISKNVCLILIIYLSFGGTSIGYCKSLSFAARENYFASQILVANDKHATTVIRSKDGLNISNQTLIYLTCKLLQRSFLTMALIWLSGDVELNPGYVNIEDIRNTRGLKIGHLNVRSLRNKVDMVRLELTKESSFDVLTLSETWLDVSVSNSEVHMPGYSCMRKDRSNNKSGGGVIAYIREGLPYTIRDDLNVNDEAECLWVEITRSKSKPVLVCCVYRAPDSDLTKTISYLDKTLSKINYTNSDVVILGDFNVDFHHSRFGKINAMERKMHNFMRSLDFTQLIKECTRITDTLRHSSI